MDLLFKGGTVVTAKSTFKADVAVTGGKISAIVLIIGMAVQLLTAFFLARLAGSVYSMMLLYRGGVPKPKQLLQMLKEYRASAKANAGKEDSHAV